MKLLGQIFAGFLLVTSCYGQKSSDVNSIKKSVTLFYEWYIATTKDNRYYSYVRGAQGENGKTRLETSEYFKRLDSLGVIGQEFIESEKARFKPCDSLLRTVPFADYSTADAGAYDDECAWLEYYYWTGGHEPHDGVEVLDVSINRNNATAVANLYYGDDRSSGERAKIYLAKRKGKWLINKIARRK